MKSWKERRPAASQALAELCALIAMNAYSFLAWSDFLFGTRFSIHMLNLGDSINLVLLLLILAVIWGVFIFNGYYKKIIREVEIQEAEGRYVVSERVRRICEIVSVILLFSALMLPASQV